MQNKKKIYFSIFIKFQTESKYCLEVNLFWLKYISKGNSIFALKSTSSYLLNPKSLSTVLFYLISSQ